jgi:Protein of unknown function (DUF1631)
MEDPGDPLELLSEARRRYVDRLAGGLRPLIEASIKVVGAALDKPTDYGTSQRRRDAYQELTRRSGNWVDLLNGRLRVAAALRLHDRADEAEAPPSATSTSGALSELTLLDDDTLQRGIQLSRVGQAIRDRSQWEYTDLRSRVASVEGGREMDEHDVFQPQVIADAVIKSWVDAKLSTTAWTLVEESLVKSLSDLVHESFREINRWLIAKGVQPHVDLRSLIRRTPASPPAAPMAPSGFAGGYPPSAIPSGMAPAGYVPVGTAPMAGAWVPTGVTMDPAAAQGGGMQILPSGHVIQGLPPGVFIRGAVPAGGPAAAAAGVPGGMVGVPAGMVGVPAGMMAGMPGMAGMAGAVGGVAQVVGSDNETVFMPRLPAVRSWLERHIPGVAFDGPQAPPSNEMIAAIGRAQAGMAQHVVFTQAGALVPASAAHEALEALRRQKEVLKQAANTPVERATVEIVALMFQSILTEDTITPSIRVWFARLQMPVLRVAIAEPDFFAAADHPARRLIDRMGACAMGFDNAAAQLGQALESEIKRVVQVVEAFPDTGRRVFQTVLTEFERFLEDYFRSRNEQSKQAVTIAQQVEQRETLAIQYTIELRKMLDQARVPEGVRHFLFQVWADVMATAAVRHGDKGEEAKSMKRVAGELVWAASPKTTREERAEVIRRLPPLLKALRAGMTTIGILDAKQDESLATVNKSLTAAFSARATGPAMPDAELAQLKQRLEELEDVLPADDIEFGDSFVLDLTGDESDALEVVADGGTKPSAESFERANTLEVGEWFKLDYRGRIDTMQLGWHGMKRQLTLFVSSGGRCVLFPKKRLAAFLEAGLLVAAQSETLTTMATRRAMAKIDADPERLVH